MYPALDLIPRYLAHNLHWTVHRETWHMTRTGLQSRYFAHVLHSTLYRDTWIQFKIYPNVQVHLPPLPLHVLSVYIFNIYYVNHTKNLCLWWCKMRCSSLCKFLQSFVACTLLGSNIFFSCMFFDTLSFLIYQTQRRNCRTYVNLIQTICSVSDFLICQGRCRQNSKYWTLRGGGLCALLLQVFHPILALYPCLSWNPISIQQATPSGRGCN
jgi:hypothetical protein